MTSIFQHIKSLNILLPLIAICGGLSACQKPIPEEIHTEIANQTSTQTAAPDLNQICQNLKNDMLSISAQRTTFALEQINQDIRLCLPLMKFKEQQQMIHSADIMYANFLKIDRTAAQQKAFDTYAHDQSQFPTIQQSQLEKLHIRDQYLLRHKNQAYIDLVDFNHQTRYQRNPYYLAKVFAPSFPEAEKVFMQELAEQNQLARFEDEHFELAAQEISRRAQFWESYLKEYPNTNYLADAQYLYNFYTNLLFKGLRNNPISQDYDGRVEIKSEALDEIERLTNIKNSRLADQARLFMKFINMDAQQKNSLIPVTASTNEFDQIRVQAQLNKYLNLKSVDLKQPRNCFQDAICH